MKFNCVERGLRVLFSHHGRVVATHPAPFIIVPIIVTVSLVTGVFIFFTAETDSELLYGPLGTQSRRDRVLLEDLYSDVVDENMFPRHQLRLDRYAILIITPINGDNLLTASYMEEILRLHDTVMNVSIQRDEKSYKFDDLCMMWNNECHQNDMLTLIDYKAANVDTVTLEYPVMLKPNGDQSVTGGYIGGVTLRDNLIVEKAKAIRLSYNLRYDTEEEDKLSLAWEEGFLHQVQNFITDKLNVYRITPSSIATEVEASSGTSLSRIAAVGFIIGTYSVLAVTMYDWVRSKPVLAVLGVLTAGLALASTFGFCAFTGVPFASTAGSMPFLILGIGVDDMFIMISAWRQTSIHKPTIDRMSRAMEEAALSITITSVTDALAFGIGCVTNFYSIRIFCAYACIAVVFCYLYMITFFAACIVLTGYREEQNRHALTFRKVLSKQEAPSKAYRVFCAGGVSRNQRQEEQNDESSDSAMMIFFKRFYGPFITHPASAIIVVLLFFTYLGLAIWGCLNLEEGGELRSNVAKDGSYLRAFHSEDKKYFRTYSLSMSVFAKSELEYWKLDVQSELESVMMELESSDYFHDSRFSVSWLRAYLQYLQQIGIVQPSKNAFLTILQHRFLKLPVYKQFVPDIVFDNKSQSIISSRFYVLITSQDTTAQERDMFLKIRSVVSRSSLDLTAFNLVSIWIYEQLILIWSNTVQTLALGIASMFLISLLLIPHPICAIIVTFSVISTLTGVIGYMAHWSIPLDTISMVTLVISIGFSVDYSAHICYAYTVAPYKDRRKRSIHALYSLGAPTLQAAISTILPILMFSTSDSHILRTFFQTMLLVILIGAAHGLIFLPVFLMILMPPGSEKPEPGSRTELRKRNGTDATSLVSHNGGAQRGRFGGRLNGNINSAYINDNDINPRSRRN